MIRIWDALVWILVIIPLVTGGFWFKKPGLSIELSQINAPVILLGVWAAVLHFRFRSSLKDASSVRLASELWAKWCDWTSRSPRVALWSGALFFGLLMAWGAVQRHHGFGSHAEDLGIFSNTLWNLTHGNGYVSSLKDGINLFQDHQSPILLTFAPFFRLFPSPVTLLILQALALACGGPALYFLFRQYRPEFDACRDPDFGSVFQTQRGFFQTYSPLLPLMYWSYLPTRNANHFDFHPEVVMLPLYLWTVWALQSSRARVRMSGFFLLLLSLACKESAGIVAAGLGAAWVLGLGPKSTQRWTRPLGAAVSLLGIAHFLFCLKVVPGLLGSGYAYMSTYSHLGSSLGEVLLSPIQKPEIFWPLIFQKNRMVFLLGTLAPLAFLPLLNPVSWIMALATYLPFFMGAGYLRVNLAFHYSIEPSIGLFLALPLALFRLDQWFARKHRPRVYAFALVCFLVLANFGRSELYTVRHFIRDEHQSWIAREALPCIDPAASIAASDPLVPWLTQRSWAHELPHLEISAPWMGTEKRVSCVIFDSLLSHYPMTEEQAVAFDQSPPTGYRADFACGSFKVYRREGLPESCLNCQPNCTPASLR